MGEARWKGKTALVTGASSGIGEAIARRLAAQGCHVILTARRRERLEKLRDELVAKHGVQADVIEADLSQTGGADAVFEKVRGLGREVDFLVNNAGLGISGTFASQTAEDDQVMLQVNVASLVRLTRLFLPGMLARGAGDVLLISSIAAFLPIPTFAVYAATKAFVKGFGEALAYELRGTGVRVTVACPGGTISEFASVGGFRKTRAHEMGSMSADHVARIALRAMARGRRSLVTGWANALMMALARLLPGFLRLRAAAVFQRAAGGRASAS